MKVKVRFHIDDLLDYFLKHGIKSDIKVYPPETLKGGYIEIEAELVDDLATKEWVTKYIDGLCKQIKAEIVSDLHDLKVDPSNLAKWTEDINKLIVKYNPDK